MSTDVVPELEATHGRTLFHWTQHHPAFEGDEHTVGEQAADRLRHGMGSWPFVFGFLAFMAVWALINAVLMAHGFDPYPFVLLNLFLSMIAGLQGAILLISAKRADAIAGKLAMHTDLQATKAREHAEELERKLDKVLERMES